MSNPDLTEARRLARHYFKTVFVAAGLKWTQDAEVEVGALVDAIVGASNFDLREHIHTTHQIQVGMEAVVEKLEALESRLSERFDATRTEHAKAVEELRRRDADVSWGDHREKM